MKSIRFRYRHRQDAGRNTFTDHCDVNGKVEWNAAYANRHRRLADRTMGISMHHGESVVHLIEKAFIAMMEKCARQGCEQYDGQQKACGHASA